jgi:transglutaminase-like putative cysteine protease
MGSSLAATGPALALFICLAGTVIFFLLPRVSSRYLSAYSPNGQIATGFSDHVQLGQIGIIQQSSLVVMHVQIDGDTHGIYDLRWRGVTLNVFDGTTWSNAHPQNVLRRSIGGRFPLLENAPEEGDQLFTGGRTIHYRVLMEPLVSNVFFLAPTPVSLEGSYRFVGVDGAGAVYDPDPEHPINSYEATSILPQLKPVELRTAAQNYPPEIMLNYLQLPPLDARVSDLAAQITASQSDNYDKALAMESYLRTHFAYTLQLPRTASRDPLAQFLFERKQGHCEYFASAMAVMLRTQHIPARVVNGFRTGEFNDVTGQYVIRASNAHSWVEAYFPEFGWISFDPTPASPLQVRNGWNRILLYTDAMASFWREWVIDYDANHQRTLGQRTGQSGFMRLRQTEDWTRREYDSMLDAARRTQNSLSQAPGRWSATGAVIAVLLVFGANATRIWRALRRHRLATHPEKAPSAAATIWYERALHRLARHGLKKTPSQTPKEFVATLPHASVRQSVGRLTEHYERARFGNSSEDAARLPELYEEVVSAARK